MMRAKAGERLEQGGRTRTRFALKTTSSTLSARSVKGAIASPDPTMPRANLTSAAEGADDVSLPSPSSQLMKLTASSLHLADPFCFDRLLRHPLKQRVVMEWCKRDSRNSRQSRLYLCTFDPCLLTQYDTYSDLAAERMDQLADLFIAVRDKGRPCEFEAGSKGRKRRKLAGAAAVKEEQLEGLDEFRKTYSDAQRYAHCSNATRNVV
jgi:hypothetical protein